MTLANRIKFGLLVWVILEVVTFSLVVGWIGAPRAILLGVISSLVGLILLRRAGTSAIMKLRANLEGRGQSGHFLDEMLATGSALALLLPGFLSDIVGLALAAPALRSRAAAWAARRGLVRPDGVRPGGRHGPGTIDLEPEEWRRTEPAHPVTKPRSP